MLRITAGDALGVLTLRLEGRLEGAWAAELEKCSRGMLARMGPRQLHVDLRGVTFVDAAGRAQLVEMRRHGAKFIADDCLTSAIVTEIEGDLVAGGSGR